MSASEKGRSQAEMVKGKAKETTGKAAGDDRMKNEGRAEMAKGRLRQGKEDMKKGR
ncbi:CsbD family protein [Nocardiopsis akebiae]|uniref:CsbD family protein n=1 Tax=Nocardiopsis akebiae TaxID=2831968 RepID=A0ABX8BYA8_9ACTN|nr:CsbD family protein [Nocardiopsis akebiae]QUX27169.1 CsbD family protein [Nocardiopsis akebiae]